MSISKLLGLVLLLAILAVAVWMILHRPPPTNVPAVRLVYDIRMPQADHPPSERLAASMIRAMQQRVDPNDILGMIWRASGPAQVEVLLPMRRATAAENRADVNDFKRMLRGSGVLEFHILAAQDEPSVQAMQERLMPGGPGPARRPGDAVGWFEVERPGEVMGRGYVIANWQHKLYVLAYLASDKSMDHRDGQKPWQLASAALGQSGDGSPVVDFSLDPQGAADFGTLTAHNLQQPLGMFLSGKLIKAAVIRSVITVNGQIDGGAQGFTRADLDYLVNTLRAGGLPAELADEPSIEQNTCADIPSPWRFAYVMGGVVLLLVDLLLVWLFLMIRRPRRLAIPPPLPSIRK